MYGLLIVEKEQGILADLNSLICHFDHDWLDIIGIFGVQIDWKTPPNDIKI